MIDFLEIILPCSQARENLDPARVPKVHAETVARQNAGLLSIVETFITPNLKDLPEADRAQAEAAIDGLKKAVAEHQAWLDKTLVPNAKGDFRIGRELYDEKLKFALMSPLDRAEIRRRAASEAIVTRAKMYEVSRKVRP